MKPNFNAIKAHYVRHEAAILAAGRSSWGIDPYAWCDTSAGIRMSHIEAIIWNAIRDVGAVFYPQYPVGDFFVDFGNPAAKFGIECDGLAFHTDPEKDHRRECAINKLGWKLRRITGADCMKHGSAGIANLFVSEVASDYGLVLGAQDPLLRRSAALVTQ